MNITVEPVVVKPDIASKNASVMLSWGDANQSGKLANRAMASQLIVVRTKVSRRLSWKSVFRKANARPVPINRVVAEDAMKTGHTSPCDVASAMAGKIIDSARTISRRPITNSEDRRSITNFSAVPPPAHVSNVT